MGRACDGQLMTDDAVTVSEDAITVRKTVDTEQFQTVAVVLELASDRNEVTRVQVVDKVPDGVPMDDIGFHLDYGAEHWSVDDGSVVFERDLEPGEEYTTIYGIRDYPEDELEGLQHEPEVGLIDAGAEDLESVVDEERSDVIRDFLSGETELSGLEETIGSEPQGPVDTEPATSEPETTEPADREPGPGVESDAEETEAADADSPEPDTDPVDATQSPEDTAADSDEETEEADVNVPLSGGVVRVLIKELREGDVDAEHRRLLRDELLDTEGTMEARVSHLQQRMSDLEAYTDALEAFIAEEGGAQAVLADLRSDFEELQSELQSTTDHLDEATDRMEAMDNRVESVAEDAETALDRSDGLTDRVADVEDEVAGFDERIDGLREELDSQQAVLQEEIEALEGDLEELEEFQQRLKSVFGNDGGPAGPA